VLLPRRAQFSRRFDGQPLAIPLSENPEPPHMTLIVDGSSYGDRKHILSELTNINQFKKIVDQ
jgi:hypothetical protein